MKYMFGVWLGFIKVIRTKKKICGISYFFPFLQLWAVFLSIPLFIDSPLSLTPHPFVNDVFALFNDKGGSRPKFWYAFTLTRFDFSIFVHAVQYYLRPRCWKRTVINGLVVCRGCSSRLERSQYILSDSVQGLPPYECKTTKHTPRPCYFLFH